MRLNSGDAVASITLDDRRNNCTWHFLLPLMVTVHLVSNAAVQSNAFSSGITIISSSTSCVCTGAVPEPAEEEVVEEDEAADGGVCATAAAAAAAAAADDDDDVAAPVVIAVVDNASTPPPSSFSSLVLRPAIALNARKR